MDEKEVLFKILTIIGYKDNKINFINTFFAYIYTEAIAEIASELSKDQQKKLSEELEKTDDAEAQKTIVLKYLSKDRFDELLTTITKLQLTDYLETIYPKLPDEKRLELTIYLNSLEDPVKTQ
jgi:hypothetical protein